MRVLIVYAHNNPKSFTHAVLEQVTRGLTDAGHTYEVIDLYAIGFNPVFTMHDATQFVHHTVPHDKLDRSSLEQAIIESAGNPLRRWMARRWVRGRSLSDLVRVFEDNRPADVREHQEKVARADGLIFIAPIFWMGFPAILKGWLERVFAYGFAYSLDPRGWAGHLDGRISLLTHRKALIITPTFFTEAEYDTGWRQAMDTILCDWCLTMAGVQHAEHVYFYAVAAVDARTRTTYLAQAYELANTFESDALRPG